MRGTVTADLRRVASEQYGRLLDDFAFITCDYPTEHDFGCAAFASRSLLSRRPDNPFRADRMDRWMAVFGDRDEPSVFRPRQGRLGPQIRRFSSTHRPVLHEGYLHDPRIECGSEIEELRREIGDRLWAVPPGLWSAWANKGRFRPRCQAILGADSVPPGVGRVVSEVGEVFTLRKQFDTEASGPAVVKLPGSGGFANLVLEPGQEDAEMAIESLWKEHAHLPRPIDVVIESWLPWESTHSVSFLLDRGGPPAFLAACEQVVDDAGIFLGSRSDTGLGDDETAIIDHLQALFDAIDADGYVGVAAIDVVVGSADAWAGLGLPLPSGRHMLVIECNPRFNYHNRIGILVERLARAWGIPSERLRWTCVNQEAGELDSAEALLASRPEAQIAVPPPPGEDPARILFAHRTEKVVELTVGLRQA